MRQKGGVYWVALLVAGFCLPAGATDLEQRLERLEVQMERLIRQLEERNAEPDSAPGTAPVAPAAPTTGEGRAPAPAERPATPFEPVTRAGEVRVRYFMGAEPMGTEPPGTEPLADGLYSLDGALQMDPFRYGAAERRLLGGSYRDPSQVRAVGILLEGRLSVPHSGTHQFEITPKPARERGDSSVSNAMTIYLWVDGEPVLNLEGVQSWRRQRVAHDLREGLHPFRLWVASNSPGFGATPIDSRLGIEVIMPGRAELTPLWRQMSAP